MTQDPEDVFDAIERDVAALRSSTPDLIETWRDLARELAFVEAARDCAIALKSAREEALHEIGTRLASWQPDGGGLHRELGVTPAQVQEALDEMFHQGPRS